MKQRVTGTGRGRLMGLAAAVFPGQDANLFTSSGERRTVAAGVFVMRRRITHKGI